MTNGTRMPGFTADLSLGSTRRTYRGRETGQGSRAEVHPAFGLCYWAALFCVAAIFDGLPGDEFVACGAAANVCGASA